MKIFSKCILSISVGALIFSCSPDDYTGGPGGKVTFSKIKTFTNGTGEEGAAEISAFDPKTNKLFIVNAVASEISVWDLSNPASPIKGNSIGLSGNPNSVAVYDGKVAVAVESAASKQDNGSIVVYNSETQLLENSYPAGPLPDMVTFSPDGKYIVAANEGEPNDDYTIDPEGSITIIDTDTDEVAMATFTAFNGQDINGLRIFGKNASVAQDVEPEYVAISDDSKTAYISLQENNGLAIVDLASKKVIDVIGLGYKDHLLSINQMDASNKDDIVGNFKNWPVLGMYQPDAIKFARIKGGRYIISANEGDARDYDGYSEEERVKDLVLDAIVFPNAEELQSDENLGRLKTTTANGDIDGDGDFDEIYAYGGRSFSIWDTSGNLVYDSGDRIGKITFQENPSLFNNDEGEVDDRSDDKGAEPESVETLKFKGRTLLFVGLERTGGILVFDVTNVSNPRYIDWLVAEGDVGPEGLLAISKQDSPTGKPLLILTNEVSSTITIYQING